MSKDLPNTTGESSDESTRLTDTPGSRLIVSTDFDGKLYEWFEVTDSLIEVITVDLFLTKLCEFFGLSHAVFNVYDIDGPIKTTSDLRRSLRSLAPFITVRSSVDVSDRIRYPPTPLAIVRPRSFRP